MESERNSTKQGLFPGLLALLVLAFGCGLDRAPVALEREERTSNSGGWVLLSFSPEAARGAAKMVVPPKGRSASRTFTAQGGELEIWNRNGEGIEDDLKVTLTVPEGGLEVEETITMTVHGNTLSGMGLEFAPAGLEFLQEAQLELELGAALVDLDLETLQAWHQHGDGTTEKAVILAVQMFEEQGQEREEKIKFADANLVRVVVQVPGFSRYRIARY